VLDVGWGSPYTLWVDKVFGYDRPSTPAQERGHDLEPLIARKVAERHGLPELTPGGWRDHPVHPELFANTDYENEHEAVIVECKASDDRWGPAEWGPDGDPEGLPIWIDFQVQHQLDACPWAERAIVGALFVDTWQLRTYEVKRDPDLAGQLIEAELRFWRDHVITRRPPPVTRGASAFDALRLIGTRPKSSTDLPWDAYDLIVDLVAARDERLRLEKVEKSLKGEIGALLGDSEHGYLGRDLAVSFIAPDRGGARSLSIPNPYQKQIRKDTNHGN